MQRKLVASALLSAGLFMGCEDGPEQIYSPPSGDPVAQNAGTANNPWTTDGEQGFGSSAGTNDNAGRARFCSERENEILVQDMVRAPIIPDTSVGGIPLRTPEGTPQHADDLVGRPEDGKFCDPTVYSNALTWGPVNEIIAFINTETRLLESIVAYTDYLGTMDTMLPDVDDEGNAIEVPVFFKVGERVKIGEQELDQYTSRSEQGNRPNAWLNYDNINKMYRAVRSTFFSQSVDPSYDCLATKICNTFYASEQAQEERQTTQLYMIDSGLIVNFSAEGYLQYMIIEPVRVAEFEAAVAFEFDDADGDVLSPTFISESVPGCSIDMSQTMTWGDFKNACIKDEGTLDRVGYDVFTQRDAVSVVFNGVDLAFQRKVSETGVLTDGARPDDDDELVSMTFTRTLNAPVKEFVPQDLAWDYRARLLERIRGAVTLPVKDNEGPDAPGGGEMPGEEGMGGEPGEGMGGAPGMGEEGMGGAPGEEPVEPEEPEVPSHPLLSFTFDVPMSLSIEPAPIEQLYWDGPSGQENWNNTVIAQIKAAYNALSPEDRAMVDPKVIEPTWIIEPFVDVVIDHFTYGKVDGPTVYKAFRNTDDRKWVIGYAHFIEDGVPYRLTVQYSLNYGAVTAITIGRGYSELDTLFNTWNEELREPLGFQMPKYPYYSADLGRMNPEVNNFALGGNGIEVGEWDRKLNTMKVRLRQPGQVESWTELTVPGDPIEDRNGYLRQIRGERYEWVPANVVRLFGREAGFIAYVEADGLIGRIGTGGFKRPMSLCPGLEISYGDDVREMVQAFVDEQGVDAYRECEIVFNYSENGNVLDAVASLTNRVSFVTVNGRAVQVDIWR
jgi:hypothetical protein